MKIILIPIIGGLLSLTACSKTVETKAPAPTVLSIPVIVKNAPSGLALSFSDVTIPGQLKVTTAFTGNGDTLGYVRVMSYAPQYFVGYLVDGSSPLFSVNGSDIQYKRFMGNATFLQSITITY